MIMHDDDRALAADYAMGLLDDPEEAAAERRLATDATFARAVDAWRSRLADFNDTAEQITPSPALWQRIAGTLRPDAVGTSPGVRRAVDAATLWNNIRFWRGAGLAGTFAAMLLAVIAIGALTTSKRLRADLVTLAQRKPVYVAVLVNDQTREAGAIINAFANGRVELVPLK